MTADLVHRRGNVYRVEPGALTAADVAAAQRAFGLDLLRVLCRRNPGGNVLVSPTSAAEALGLLHPAATGPTAGAVADLLHLPAWSPDLVAAVQAHTRALTALRPDGDADGGAPDAVLMSNRLWLASGPQPEAGYLDDIATAFDASVQTLDFAADAAGATGRINAAVDEDTRGRITRLFDRPLAPDTVAVLTDAVYLKARWAIPFTRTAPAPFASPAGERTVDLMAGAGGTGRAAHGWRAVELPYRDGTLAAVAVLPPEDTDPGAVDAATLAALDAAVPTPVDVRLPRLHLEQTHPLREPLAELGLPARGDYARLGDGVEVDAVVQRTVLDVDELGTEAAAATGVIVVTASFTLRETVTFDRPFLFVLTDTGTRSPLFVAVVSDPSS
jgi:serpin B